MRQTMLHPNLTLRARLHKRLTETLHRLLGIIRLRRRRLRRTGSAIAEVHGCTGTFSCLLLHDFVFPQCAERLLTQCPLEIEIPEHQEEYRQLPLDENVSEGCGTAEEGWRVGLIELHFDIVCD